MRSTTASRFGFLITDATGKRFPRKGKAEGPLKDQTAPEPGKIRVFDGKNLKKGSVFSLTPTCSAWCIDFRGDRVDLNLYHTDSRGWERKTIYLNHYPADDEWHKINRAVTDEGRVIMLRGNRGNLEMMSSIPLGFEQPNYNPGDEKTEVRKSRAWEYLPKKSTEMTTLPGGYTIDYLGGVIDEDPNKSKVTVELTNSELSGTAEYTRRFNLEGVGDKKSFVIENMRIDVETRRVGISVTMSEILAESDAPAQIPLPDFEVDEAALDRNKERTFLEYGKPADIDLGSGYSIAWSEARLTPEEEGDGWADAEVDFVLYKGKDGESRYERGFTLNGSERKETFAIGDVKVSVEVGSSGVTISKSELLGPPSKEEFDKILDAVEHRDLCPDEAILLYRGLQHDEEDVKMQASEVLAIAARMKKLPLMGGIHSTELHEFLDDEAVCQGALATLYYMFGAEREDAFPRRLLEQKEVTDLEPIDISALNPGEAIDVPEMANVGARVRISPTCTVTCAKMGNGLELLMDHEESGAYELIKRLYTYPTETRWYPHKTFMTDEGIRVQVACNNGEVLIGRGRETKELPEFTVGHLQTGDVQESVLFEFGKPLPDNIPLAGHFYLRVAGTTIELEGGSFWDNVDFGSDELMKLADKTEDVIVSLEVYAGHRKYSSPYEGGPYRRHFDLDGSSDRKLFALDGFVFEVRLEDEGVRITRSPMTREVEETTENKFEQIKIELQESAMHMKGPRLGSWRVAMDEVKRMVSNNEDITPLLQQLGTTLRNDQDSSMKTTANYILEVAVVQKVDIGPALSGLFAALDDPDERVCEGAYQVLRSAQLEGITNMRSAERHMRRYRNRI